MTISAEPFCQGFLESHLTPFKIFENVHDVTMAIVVVWRKTIISHASTLRPVQYVTGCKRKGKAYKKEKVFCMYVGLTLVDLF